MIALIGVLVTLLSAATSGMQITEPILAGAALTATLSVLHDLEPPVNPVVLSAS